MTEGLPCQDHCAIGMDIGGAKMEGSLVNSDGRVLRTLREPTPQGNREMLARIAEMVETIRDGQEIQGVGFAVPGSLHPKTGQLRNAPNSPAIDGAFLKKDLERTLPEYRVAVENDANCLAISEHRFGAARNYSHVVAIILGSGVGGGVIHEGRLFVGSRGLAPEFGHMPVDINGRFCADGNKGSVEAYLSGPSIRARYRDAGGDPAVETPEIFTRRADCAARAVLEETRLIFARFIAALVSIYDPEAFVLGGGVSRQDFFYSQSELISQFLFGTRQTPPILKAEGGDASGKLGAATLILG